MQPETKKGKRTELAKQYNTPDIWWVKCLHEKKWIPEHGCCGEWDGVKCCTHNGGSEMVDGKLVVECNAE